jgi:hypothetical protein
MRIAVFTLCLLLPTIGLAEDWTPPENPDPQKILQEVREDVKYRRYEVALCKILWFHENALALRPSLSGVRLSFALSGWLELGEVYPPALEKMKQVRDDTEKRIRDQKRIRVRFEDFHDFVAFNRTLREEERTAKAFEWLDKTNEEDAQRVYGVAESALIKQRAYELCGKYIEPERDLTRIREFYTMSLAMADKRFGEQHRKFAEKKFLNDVTTLVAILVQNDRKVEASEVASEAKKIAKDPDLQTKLGKQMESALSGTVPKPWP